MSGIHWLPIHKRMNFKVAILTACLPLQPHILPSTQSFAAFLKSVSPPSSQGETDFGRRAFSSAAPQIWNHIPAAIKISPSLDTFKRHLKTHYFTSP